jgi:NADH dehydrogenase (ubiquinone) 1 alpha subcomplex subunit 5
MRWTSILRSTRWPTGITGLYPHPTARNQLLESYRATLATLQGMPEHSVYRQSVETLTKERLAIVEGTEDTKEMEQKLGQGLIEEVVVMANEELRLAEKVKLWKAYYPVSPCVLGPWKGMLMVRWEKLEVEPPEGQWSNKSTVEQ